MRDLLIEAGFRLRSATRADCARCEGRSRGTVSYNAEVAHCFRCGWAANRRQVARASACGFPSDPGEGTTAVCSGKTEWRMGTRQAKSLSYSQRLRARREMARRRAHEAAIRAFVRWREERLRRVSDLYWGLSRAALRAERALAAMALGAARLTAAEQELAWDALARFRHAEARLSAAFDLLMCAKASAWLENDAAIEELFELSRTGF